MDEVGIECGGEGLNVVSVEMDEVKVIVNDGGGVWLVEVVGDGWERVGCRGEE